MNADLNDKPLVLALVGTDHHPFDRLVGWMDRWAQSRPDATVFVQHGSSAAPRVAGGQPMLTHDQLVSMVRTAVVVVTHGGPATIEDVRSSGRRPLVVPRDPQLREHVDAHQQRFTRRLGRARVLELCEAQSELFGALDRGMADRLWLATSTVEESARTARAVEAVGAVIDDLLNHEPTGWLSRTRRSASTRQVS